MCLNYFPRKVCAGFGKHSRELPASFGVPGRKMRERFAVVQILELLTNFRQNGENLDVSPAKIRVVGRVPDAGILEPVGPVKTAGVSAGQKLPPGMENFSKPAPPAQSIRQRPKTRASAEKPTTLRKNGRWRPCIKAALPASLTGTRCPSARRGCCGPRRFPR